MTLALALGRTSLVALVALATTACIEGAELPRDAGVVKARDDRAVVPDVPSIRVEKVATTTKATEASAALAVVTSERDDAGVRPECRQQVRWMGLARCVHEGMIYAAGAVAGVKEIGLARSTAAERARKGLFPGVKDRPTETSEVVDFVRCHGTSYALARIRAPADAGPLPACDPTVLVAEKLPGDPCPGWTRRVVWHEEDGQLAAVGAAMLRNASLADATAANRARAELARSIHDDPRAHVHTPGHKHDHDEVPAEAPALSEIGRERAVCDGVTYVKVSIRSAGDH
ncbi:hypothetical protein L6R52_30885 [Myxococcota bacterium]|nr:hypothetical protein [Myxococcota bacterium]